MSQPLPQDATDTSAAAAAGDRRDPHSRQEEKQVGVVLPILGKDLHNSNQGIESPPEQQKLPKCFLGISQKV